MSQIIVNNILKNQRNIIAIIAMILLISNIFLSYKIFSSEQNTVIIPSLKPEDKIFYNPNIASKKYFMEISQDIMHLFLDVNPDNIKNSHNRLLNHIHPKIENRSKIISELRKLQEKIIKNKYSSFFDVDLEKIFFNEDSLELLISGKFKMLSYNTITKKENKTYHIKFNYYKGRYYVSELEEVINGKAN